MNIKKSLLITLLGSFVVLSPLVSCSKKTTKNKVNTNGVNPNGTIMGTGTIVVGSNPLQTTGLNAQTMQTINSIESQAPCPQGGQRIYKQYHSKQVSGTHTTITGQFVDGAIPTTADSQLYVGFNYVSKDFIFMQKVVNGAQVTAFNATLSLCQIPNVISPDRNLTTFTVRAMNLDVDTNCGFGSVDAASTFVYSVKDPGQTQYVPYGCGTGMAYPPNPYIATYGICTNFAKIACAGRY